MRYWSGSEVTVHVMDGSEQPIPAGEMAGLAANVNYHHLPISMFDRLGKAGDLVQTEYVAMLGDDELYLPDTLQACIQELESDQTLVSCIGRCLGFQLISKILYAHPVFTEWANYSVPQDDPIGRMIHHMDTYTLSTIYSVVRTPVWSLAWTIVNQNKQYPVYAFHDFQFELAVCYQGKSKVIPNLMRLISNENARVGGGYKKGGPIVEFDDWWVDEGTSASREEFLTAMANALCHRDIGKLESVREGLRAALNALNEGIDRDRGRLTRGRTRIAIRSAITMRIPNIVKSPIRKMLLTLPTVKRKPFLQAAKNLESTGVKVDFEELSQIIDLIQQFHATPTGYQDEWLARPVTSDDREDLLRG